MSETAKTTRYRARYRKIGVSPFGFGSYEQMRGNDLGHIDADLTEAQIPHAEELARQSTPDGYELISCEPLADPECPVTAVRCFRRRRTDDGRRGVWAMTGPKRGAFFHGDREAIDAPKWDLAQLIEAAADSDDDILQVEEVSPEEALAEVAGVEGWQDHLQQIFDRHPAPEARQ